MSFLEFLRLVIFTNHKPKINIKKVTTKNTLRNETPIDVVITWVDGKVPKLEKKRLRYLKQEKFFSIHGSLNTRFDSNNEIEYCVASILKFAPFVRNIFIVADGQSPKFSDSINKYFPKRINSIKIIDHKELFKGYEKFLPTFNS